MIFRDYKEKERINILTTAAKRYKDFTVIFKDPNLNGFKLPIDYLGKINNSQNLKSLLKYLIFQ